MGGGNSAAGTMKASGVNRRRQRGLLVPVVAVLVLALASLADAARHRHQSPFLGQLTPRATRAPPSIVDNDQSTMLSRRRRLVLSQIASIRGGSASDGTRCALGVSGGDANNAENNIGRQYYLNKVYVDGRGESPKTSILSTVAFVFAQSINVAAAAFVVSGCFGAWAAAWLVGKLHNFLPTVAKNAYGGNKSSGLGGMLRGSYRLTTIASLGLLLLHVTGIQPNTIHSRVSDAAFVAILWTYSRLVDPVLGGMIGCAHLALGIASTILGSPLLVYGLDGLKNVRFEKLGQYVGKEEQYVSDEDERTSRVPVVQSRPRNEFVAFISNLMGSASLLLAFPQYFLGLYMLGGTLESWSSAKQFSWRFLDRWTQWLGEGINSSVDEDAAGGSVIQSPSLTKLSQRLVALYWTITVIKTATYYIMLT